MGGEKFYKHGGADEILGGTKEKTLT